MFALIASTRMTRCSCILIAVLALVVGGNASAASIVNIASDSGNSTEGLGAFTGSLSYSADSAFSTTGLLTVTLTNTSNAANGGFITGMAFNIGGSDATATAALLDSPAPTHPFATLTGGGLSGEPFGNPFDAGAALGGSFLGGGSPNGGIGVGQTGTFSFLISALDAGGLNASDFLNGGPFAFNFVVRFRGFEDGGSDKVPAVAMMTTPNVVPVPMPLALGAVGLIAAMVGSYRLRNKSRKSQPQG